MIIDICDYLCISIIQLHGYPIIEICKYALPRWNHELNVYMVCIRYIRYLYIDI